MTEPSIPPRERLVGETGTRTFVREYGPADGAPVVLLHGFPQTGHCWRMVAPALADRHRVIVPDLPGYMRSDPPSSYDPPTIARDLLTRLRDGLDLRSMAVVGHDWGGALAYALAMNHPASVERLVVVNSPFRQIDYSRAWHMFALSLPVLPELAFTLAPEQLVRLAHVAVSIRRPWTDEDFEIYARALKGPWRVRPPLAYYRGSIARAAKLGLAAVLGRRAPGEPKRITCPTMVVWGARDPVLPVRLVDSIVRDIPQARVETLPEVGHFVPEEAPEELSKLLRDFLS